MGQGASGDAATARQSSERGWLMEDTLSSVQAAHFDWVKWAAARPQTFSRKIPTDLPCAEARRRHKFLVCFPEACAYIFFPVWVQQCCTVPLLAWLPCLSSLLKALSRLGLCPLALCYSPCAVLFAFQRVVKKKKRKK